MKRLCESWIAAERSRGMSLAQAIRLLNDYLGTKYNHSRVAEWRRGVYVPAPSVLSLMLLRTMPWALEQAGIEVSEEQQRLLNEKIWVPAEENDGTLHLL